MNDPRSEQRAFYAWLVGLLLGAVLGMGATYYAVVALEVLR